MHSPTHTQSITSRFEEREKTILQENEELRGALRGIQGLSAPWQGDTCVAGLC